MIETSGSEAQVKKHDCRGAQNGLKRYKSLISLNSTILASSTFDLVRISRKFSDMRNRVNSVILDLHIIMK
jgi:hypothetical protein